LKKGLDHSRKQLDNNLHEGAKRYNMRHQSWDIIECSLYGDDEYGVMARFGHFPTAADMARCFEGTDRAGWGNVLMGKRPGGVYAEIISGIIRNGIEAFLGMGDDWRDHTKNKTQRHLRMGRRAIKRADRNRNSPIGSPVRARTLP
jgi:hypothetical protein